MGRPLGPIRRHINLAPPAEVVEAVKAYAKSIHVSQTEIIESAVRKFLREKGVVIGPPRWPAKKEKA